MNIKKGNLSSDSNISQDLRSKAEVDRVYICMAADYYPVQLKIT